VMKWLGLSCLFYFLKSINKKEKKETYNNSTIKTTWYIAGHIYERVGTNGEILHTEITISAAGRLGVAYTNTANNSLDYNYELSDHLGNVRAVIRKAAPGSTNPIDILSYADYFPFGWQIPGRNQQGDYRYAYQGQEKDPETGWEAFELRMYDGRVGRWMTTDPYSQYHSPYLAMGNRPVSGVDPDGGKFFDWVEVGGEIFYDSRIRSQEQATAKYGNDAIHHEVGTTYMSDEGNVMLGALGTFTLNGAFYESVDHADLFINRHPSVALAGGVDDYILNGISYGGFGSSSIELLVSRGYYMTKAGRVGSMLKGAFSSPVANAEYLGTQFGVRYLKYPLGINASELKSISGAARGAMGWGTAAKIGGRFLGWGSAIYISGDVVFNFKSKSNNEIARATMDITMTMVGLYGGPWGAGISIGYFGVMMIYDYTTD
jgi:RHS repeat-associated protein